MPSITVCRRYAEAYFRAGDKKGKLRGDLRHHTVPIPRTIGKEGVRQLATRLNAPLRCDSGNGGGGQSDTVTF
jgi:hypothetical protein